jgi:hypothetical protein
MWAYLEWLDGMATGGIHPPQPVARLIYERSNERRAMDPEGYRFFNELECIVFSIIFWYL